MVAQSPVEATEGADFLITMLADADAIEASLGDGALDNLSANGMWLQMSTVGEEGNERLARLEGQHHALSKELTDNFKTVQDTLTTMQQQVEEIHTVKSGLLKSEKLSDVLQRIDGQLGTLQKQIVAISNNLQIDQSKLK